MTDRPEDYYAQLGLGRTASPDEVRQAYRAVARRFHPDVNAHPAAGQAFAEAQEAYDTLSNPASRTEYDAALAGASPRRSRYKSSPVGQLRRSWTSHR